MPHSALILGQNGYEIKQMHREGNSVVIRAQYSGAVSCPHCGKKRLRKKDHFIRTLRHTAIGSRHMILHLDACKFHCLSCNRYFNQRFPGVRPRYRSTEAFRKQIFLAHYDGICRKRLSERQRIGTATVERWFHDFLKRKESEMSAEPCPEELGIDEHFFSKRKGYATTFCDLKNHKVYDVVMGRSEASLEGYLCRLQGKNNVRLVCIDLSVTYRSIVKKNFPNARIVADRFHVIKLVNQHFMATWRELDPVSSKNRGMVSLMRRHEENLSEEQVIKMGRYFEEHPEMEAIYQFKQELTTLLRIKERKARECKKLIPQLLEFIEKLKKCGFEKLETLGRTLESWDEEVAAMWRFTKNNGITEGFHNKMETISRMAYGFRNFENYRLRVRAMCS